MDEHTSCQDIQGFGHESVKHSIGEYMKNQAHTNGVESLCTMLKHATQRRFPQDKHETFGATLW